jgi:aspartate-semialdehyde dehydrogenase
MSEARMSRHERRHAALDSLNDPGLLRELSYSGGRG